MSHVPVSERIVRLLGEFESFVPKYEGPKISMIITGGGVSSLNLAMFPGISRIIDEVYVPYSVEKTLSFITSNLGPEAANEFTKIRAVSSEAASMLCEAGAANSKDNVIIACTAALTTTRFRRGENHAWIAVKKPGIEPAAEYFSLPKMSQTVHESLPYHDILVRRVGEDNEMAVRILEKILEVSNES